MHSSRVARRVRERDLTRLLTALVVGVLSFQHLGRPASPPPEACAGARRSPLQERLLRSVASRVRYFVRVVSSVKLDANSGRKASDFLGALEELSATALTGLYGGTGGGHASSSPAQVGGRPRRVEACRVDLPAAACTFHPERYLRGFAREAFLHPSLLALDDPPRAPRVGFHCDDAEHLRLFDREDAADMVELELSAELPRGRLGEALAAGIFPVAKSTDRDRLITNRRPANSQERSLGASAALFPHACLLCEVRLSRRQRLKGHGDDLPDFYHTCRCSEDRTRTNQVGPELPFRSVAHSRAAARLLLRRGHVDAGARVRVLQRSLPMGDRNATDFGELAHLGVLRSVGLAQGHELASYRTAPPRGDVWEFVMIDDHIVTEVVDVPRRGRA